MFGIGAAAHAAAVAALYKAHAEAFAKKNPYAFTESTRSTKICGACGGSGKKTIGEPFMLTVSPPVSSVKWRTTDCPTCRGKGSNA